ncbi:MAG: hypothetical protein AAB580_01780 [Patescibacteria group bacterium]
MTYLALSDQDAGTFNPAPGAYTFKAAIGAEAGPLASRLTFVLSNIIGIFTVIAGLAFIYYFILATINWVTAGGDTQKVTLARQQIINALIGLVIVVLANPITALLERLLGVPLTNPATLINQFL